MGNCPYLKTKNPLYVCYIHGNFVHTSSANTLLQPCMGLTHNVHMIVVPLTSGAHWHGGCPPAPSREKHYHCWQQVAQHSSHSVRMVTKKECWHERHFKRASRNSLCHLWHLWHQKCGVKCHIHKVPQALLRFYKADYDTAFLVSNNQIG